MKPKNSIHPSSLTTGWTGVNFYTFLPGALPPLHPNTNPCLNLTLLCPPGLPKAESTLNREAWKFYLLDYPDRCFLDSILNIIDVGTSIGHLVPSRSQICKNLKSATDFPSNILKEIESLHIQGCIHGPFKTPPLPGFRCSPLGIATCKRNPKCRVFNHYSWPPWSSVNNETPDFGR